MVFAEAVMRVASLTSPLFIGTLRSTRTSTRLPFTSTWSSVRNADTLPPGKFFWLASAQLAHRDGGVGHTVGEAPLVVIPRHHADQRAVHNLGLVHVEDRAVRIVVEIHRNVRVVGEAEDALELL